MPTVLFSYADVRATFFHKTQLKCFIPEIFKMENILLEKLQYVFCSDQYLLRINKQFLQHDNLTDIITFDLSESLSTKVGCIGEIYISVDRVKENAKDLGIVFQEEIQRVIFHGALHLCGYKDKKKSEIEKMRYKENVYLRLFEKRIIR